MQAFLQNAFDNSAVPRRTATGAQIVRQGNRYRTLVDSNGLLTPAGRSWETISGAELQTLPFDSQQTPVREGSVEYITVRGQQRITRKYNERKNDFDYTRLGMQFYATRRFECHQFIRARGPTDNPTHDLRHTQSKPQFRYQLT